MNIEPENDQGGEVDEADEVETEAGSLEENSDPTSTEADDEAADDPSKSDTSNGDDSGDGEEAEDDDSLGTIAEIEEAGPCKRVIKASVTHEKIATRLRAAYDELVNTVSLPGFRRGRVPRRLLEKRYGEEVDKDIKDQLLAESFAEVHEANEFRLLGSPKFDNVVFDHEKDFTYTAVVQVHPQFDLPKYKGLKIDREAIEIETSKIDEELEKLREDRATPVPIEPSEAGEDDQFVGTYKLFVDDTEVKESATVQFVPKSDRVEHFTVGKLSDAVGSWDRSAAGTSDGAPLSLDVEVPAGYPDEVLRGKAARLEFTLEQTHRRELPEIDDEFASGLGCENADDLRKTIRDRLETDLKQREDRRLEEELIKQVLDAVKLDLPTDLIEDQRKTAEEQITQRLLADGKSEDEIAKEKAEAGDSAADRLSNELKEFFVLERIGENEKIVATEDEVRSRVQMMAYVYQMDPGALLGELKSSGRLDEIRLNLRNEKVKAFLRKKAKIKDPEGSTSDDANPSGENASEEPEREEEASQA